MKSKISSSTGKTTAEANWFFVFFIVICHWHIVKGKLLIFLYLFRSVNSKDILSFRHNHINFAIRIAGMIEISTKISFILWINSEESRFAFLIQVRKNINTIKFYWVFHFYQFCTKFLLLLNSIPWHGLSNKLANQSIFG